MKLSLPEFAQGIHYAEMRGDHPDSNGIYRFKLLADVALRLPSLATHTLDISLRDVLRREWGRITGDTVIIRKGYAWNGATPKRWCRILKRWIGVPDFEPTRLATLYHDIFFQFVRVADFPLTVNNCNEVFFQIMSQQGFKLANTYFGAVKDFGERFAGKYPKQGEHSVVL